MAATRAAYGAGAAAPLRRPTWWCRADVRAQCALLKGIALRYVMRRARLDAALRPRAGGAARAGRRRWLSGRPTALDPVFAPLWRAAADDAARLRVVIDQVASLTDPAALAWHARLRGALAEAPVVDRLDP